MARKKLLKKISFISIEIGYLILYFTSDFRRKCIIKQSFADSCDTLSKINFVLTENPPCFAVLLWYNINTKSTKKIFCKKTETENQLCLRN